MTINPTDKDQFGLTVAHVTFSLHDNAFAVFAWGRPVQDEAADLNPSFAVSNPKGC